MFFKQLNRQLLFKKKLHHRQLRIALLNLPYLN